MEQKYVDRLNELKFSTDPNSVKTVLSIRAHHNEYNDVTDKTTIIIKMPTCYGPEEERDLFKKVFDTLSICYKKLVDPTFFSPGRGYSPWILDNEIGFSLNDVLTEQEAIAQVLKMLDYGFEQKKADYLSTPENTPENVKKRHTIAKVARRLRVIQTFIEAGYVSYESSVENYDPLD